MQQLTNIAQSIITFINTVAVPLVFAVAFIVFLFGVFRYYIVGGANPEKRKEGTQLIMYSIIGFAIMIVVWGLVNLVVGTFGFTNNQRPCLPTFSGGPCSSSGPSSSTDTNPPVPGRGTVTNPANATQNPTTNSPLIGPRP